MATDIRNILHGIVQIFLDGADMGYTSDGVAVEKTMDIFEKEVDQELDATDICPTKFTLTVKTQLAEATLVNLKRVWEEPDAIVTNPGVTDTLYLGAFQDLPEHQLIFTGRNRLGLARTYTFFRAKKMETSEHTLQKGDKVVFPITFRCLMEFSQTLGKRYGHVVDSLV